MEIEIKGEKLEFEFGSIYGVVYDFETLTDGRLEFDMKRTLAVHIAMYGVLLRCNPGMTLTMEEFVGELNHIALAKALTEYFVKRMAVLSQGEEIAHAFEEAEDKAKRGAEGGPLPAGGKKKERTLRADGTLRGPEELDGKGPAMNCRQPNGGASTGTGCTGRLWATWGWIRRIFLRG